MSEVKKSICMLRKTTVDSIDRAELDRELTPILAEVLMLKSGNDHHPAIRQLFHWLTDPGRTGEEFTYVIGELADNVADDVRAEEGEPEEEDHMYLCITAAQALAVKCPVLEGAWEQAAWTLLIVAGTRHHGSISSEHLSAWIIYVITDPQICPNPYLRYECLGLLTLVLDLKLSNELYELRSKFEASCQFDENLAEQMLAIKY